jgi:hypothetical protein
VLLCVPSGYILRRIFEIQRQRNSKYFSKIRPRSSPCYLLLSKWRSYSRPLSRLVLEIRSCSSSHSVSTYFAHITQSYCSNLVDLLFISCQSFFISLCLLPTLLSNDIHRVRRPGIANIPSFNYCLAPNLHRLAINDTVLYSHIHRQWEQCRQGIWVGSIIWKCN